MWKSERKLLVPLWLFLILAEIILRYSEATSLITIQEPNVFCLTCYRKIPGKKVAEVHIRNTLECERLEDCRQECEMQKTVLCEGFSYRRINSGSRGICELVSMPFSRMDLSKDFTTDSQYDYHGRDASCYRRITGHSYNNENEWRYPASKSPYRPLGLTDESWRTRQLDREFSPRFGDRIPDDFYGKPKDYDRRPGYETHYDDDSRHNLRPYGQQNQIFYRRGGGGRRGPDYGDYEYRKSYPSRIHDDGRNSFRIMDMDDYPQYPPKVNYYPKYPPIRDSHRYPDSMSDTNQMGPPFIVDHRKDPNHHWGYSGGTYGSQYGYDTNHVANYNPPKIDNNHHKHPRPFSNNHVYGQFYNYGGAFGYGDNYIPRDRDVTYGGTGYIRDCSVRTGAGFKIERSLIRSTYLAQNVDDCENLCLQEKTIICKTFSYRYNVESTDPTNNCHLSGIAYKDLNFYDDIEPDRNYDIYVMSKDRKNCIPAKQSSQQPPDECFWRVKSGFGMPEDVIKDKLTVAGFGDCEAECIKSQEFTCRSFVFRHSQGESDDSKNCFLSNWSTQEISPEKLVDFDGAELYERGSFGRGCEPYPLKPTLPPTDREVQYEEEVCYSTFRRPCRLSPYSITLSMRVDTELDCRKRCTKMRHRDDVPCWAYSYKIRGDKSDNNCLLSDIPSRDLRPGVDYVYDDDHVLFAWKELESRCQQKDDSYHIVGPASEPGRPLNFADVTRPSDYDDRPKPPPDGDNPGYHYPPPDKGKPSFDYPPPDSDNQGYHYPPPNKGKPSFDYPPPDKGKPGFDYPPSDNDSPGYHYPPPDKGKPAFYYPPPPSDPEYHYPPPPPLPDKGRPGYDCPPRDNENPRYYYPLTDKGRPGFDYKLLLRRPSQMEYDRPGSDYLPHDSGRPPLHLYGRPPPDFQRPDPNRRRPYFNGNRYPPPDGNHIHDDYPGVIPLDSDKGSLGSHYNGGMSDDKMHYPDGDHDNRLGAFIPNDQTIFQHYTVNGYPCKRGTKCESNKITGFWSCETEGSELGSWDYCCQPKSHCGYSKGFDYPWCYVGPSEKQWRPCSEKYFPYLPSSRPIIHPQRGHQEMERRIDDDDLDKNFLSRRWPVAYLHCEPPPGEKSPVTTTEIQKVTNSTSIRNRKWIAKTTEPPEKELRFIQAVPLIDPPENNKEIENTNNNTQFNNSESLLTRFRTAKVERINNPFQQSN
ncbi:uncharacterized protein LOC127285038 isoform X2 [Leptopilina boulardi]|uniref:uncharacterized protein LOC127285038 isoform X2 n=1 Tax=Leptopilina boulardi TaxID=63433 RepID=UPI0021F6588F|nr:uncharacterized protein LOC127285038 isoform X2 [Leptopilina boulardi]